MRSTAIVIMLLALGALMGLAPQARAVDGSDTQADTIGRTPPRLGLVEGQVSFWRPGAQDWVEAQVNTALAPGDQLYVGADGNLELQIGGQAFVRGGADAQIGLESQEPDFLQFKVTAGSVSFDLRSLAPGRTVEVDTPGAAFAINHEGYYRLDVSDERTVFITRRGGRATATTADGEEIPIAANQAVTIEGVTNFKISAQVSPPLDSWDRWNYARTDQVLEAYSAHYVSPDTYGVSDLDRYGTWRVAPEYGYVWVPTGVAAGWVPYSTGTWMLDPFYGWTWVDTAPWGWAPYHYGRWVYVTHHWCWAPGPIVARAVYAPALVAFFGQPGVHISIGIGGPLVGWVALGWGEPLIPWWGRPGFIHHPWWGGWHGPRLVNGRRVRHGAVVRFKDIHVYRNTRRPDALVVVSKKYFGHGPIRRDHFIRADLKNLRPNYKAPQFKASPASYVPTTHRGMRPPQKSFHRSVVTRHWESRASGFVRQVPARSYRRPSAMDRPSPSAGSVWRKEDHIGAKRARKAVSGINSRREVSPLPRHRSGPQAVQAPIVPRHGNVRSPERIEVKTPTPPQRPTHTRSTRPKVVGPRLPDGPSAFQSPSGPPPGPDFRNGSPVPQRPTHHRPGFQADNPSRRVSPSAPGDGIEQQRQQQQRRQMEYEGLRSRNQAETVAPRRDEWRSPENRQRSIYGGHGRGRFENRFR